MSYEMRQSVSAEGRLTAVNSKMLLQVMFVFEGFSTLAAFELAVSSGFAEQRRLLTENKQRDDGEMENEWESLSRLESQQDELMGEVNSF